MQKLIKNALGLGLIEMLIALAILASGIVVLVKFQGDLLRNRSVVNQQREAISLARGKMDELRHYSVITTTTGYTAYNDIAAGSSATVGGNTTFNLAWTVSTVVSPPHKVIQVTVSWTDPMGAAQTITVDGIVGSVDPTESGEVMQGL